MSLTQLPHAAFNKFNSVSSEFYQIAKFKSLNASIFDLQINYSTENIFFLENIKLINYSFNFFFCFFVLLSVLLFVFSYGFKLLTNISNQFNLFNTIFSYFSEIEEEIGSIDDGLIYYLLFGFIVVWFFFFTLFGVYLQYTISWVLTLFFLSLATVAFVPTFVLKNYGLSFVSYIRGAGKTSSLVYENILDFLSILIIYIRFLVQNIRFVFIFLGFIELYEFIYFSLSDFTSFSYNNNYAWENYKNNFVLNFLFFLLINWIFYFYYLGHLTILFIAQLSVFFALSFWLFFFMYSSFTIEQQEKYFFFRRNL